MSLPRPVQFFFVFRIFAVKLRVNSERVLSGLSGPERQTRRAAGMRLEVRLPALPSTVRARATSRLVCERRWSATSKPLRLPAVACRPMPAHVSWQASCAHGTPSERRRFIACRVCVRRVRSA